MTEEDVVEVIERFRAAGFGEGSWTDALGGLADLTGSMGGELIGLGADAAVPFNWMTGLPQEAAAEFIAVGAGDPRVNSRVRVGLSAPELAILDEADFTSADDARRFPAYGEWLRRYDLAHGCLSPLLRQDGLLVGMAVMRTASQGGVTPEQKRAISLIAPHVRGAVRTQLAIGRQGWALANPMLEMMSQAAIICDAHGRLIACSAGAQSALVSQANLRILRGQVMAVRERDDRALRSAIARVAGATTSPPFSPVVLRDRDGHAPIVISLTAAPLIYRLRHGPSALLILPSAPDRDEKISSIARELFDLTRTEALIAARLAGGSGPQAVAESMNIAIGTVRTHIRRVFEKCEVRSLVELVALLNRL
ncbi:MAG: helix-turn-helix transcriptional regulator [Brevundimonas sp.]|nr:helix-turn-helix transcriptional regulator [Brevundimonas sp.]